MSSIGRIDQAMIVLRDRLRKLSERSGPSIAGSDRAEVGAKTDPLVPLRQMVRRGQIGKDELRRALVRTLLADSLGDEWAGNLALQSIADRVSSILEQNEAGQKLLDRALADLE